MAVCTCLANEWIIQIKRITIMIEPSCEVKYAKQSIFIFWLCESCRITRSIAAYHWMVEFVTCNNNEPHVLLMSLLSVGQTFIIIISAIFWQCLSHCGASLRNRNWKTKNEERRRKQKIVYVRRIQAQRECVSLTTTRSPIRPFVDFVLANVILTEVVKVMRLLLLLFFFILYLHHKCITMWYCRESL